MCAVPAAPAGGGVRGWGRDGQGTGKGREGAEGVRVAFAPQRTPETFWLAARWGRRVLGQVLEATAADGDLSADEADWAASRIHFDNAAELYGRGASG